MRKAICILSLTLAAMILTGIEKVDVFALWLDLIAPSAITTGAFWALLHPEMGYDPYAHGGPLLQAFQPFSVIHFAYLLLILAVVVVGYTVGLRFRLPAWAFYAVAVFWICTVIVVIAGRIDVPIAIRIPFILLLLSALYAASGKRAKNDTRLAGAEVPEVDPPS